jgi:Fe-S cluster assembly iron-binding protein IscA
LQITKQATDHIQSLRQEKGAQVESVARLVRADDKLQLRFSPRPVQGDQVVASDGLDVYLGPGVQELLNGTIIDARTEEQRTWLVVRKAS